MFIAMNRYLLHVSYTILSELQDLQLQPFVVRPTDLFYFHVSTLLPFLAPPASFAVSDFVISIGLIISPRLSLPCARTLLSHNVFTE